MIAPSSCVFPCCGDLVQDHKQSQGLQPGGHEQVTDGSAHAHPQGAAVAQLLLIAARQEHLSLFSKETGK